MYTILITFILLFVGVAILLEKSHFLEKISATILLNLGLLGFVPFLLREHLNIGYGDSAQYLFYVSLIILLAALVVNYNRSGNLKIWEYIIPYNLSKLEIIFIVISIVTIVRAFYVPVRGWDAYSLYDSRGRFFESGLRQSELLEFSKYDEVNSAYYFSYPPMTSSIHAVLYARGFQSPTFIYTMMYFSLIAMCYLLINKKGYSLINIFLFISPIAFNRLMMGQVFASYTNLPMICFQFGCIYFSIKYFEKGKMILIFISALMLAFSSWTRSLEPTFISFLVFSLFMLFVARSKHSLSKFIIAMFYVLISIVPRLIWSNYVLATAGSNGEIAPSIGKLLSSITNSLYVSNLFDVAFFVYQSLFSMQNYIMLFVVILTLLFFVKIKDKKDKIMIYSFAALISSLYLIMIAGTLYFSVTFVWWKEIPGSFLRSNLILIPLIMILSSYVVEYFNNGSKK